VGWTPLVGRDAELGVGAQARADWQPPRRPKGGTGKTRLALAAAPRTPPTRRRRVELAPVDARWAAAPTVRPGRGRKTSVGLTRSRRSPPRRRALRHLPVLVA
jgi:hypothetical protein